MKTSLPLLFLMSFVATSIWSQEVFPEDYDGIADFIVLDSMVISAQKSGLNIPAFIRKIETDTSFSVAFENLRKISYSFRNDLQFFDKKGNVKASYYSVAEQESDGNCRTMMNDDPEIKGDFFKKDGDYRYLTAKMYDKVFFTHGEVCNKETPSASPKGIAKYYAELKKFIFEPGEQVEVPLVSKKTAIFSPELVKFYDYKISESIYQKEIPCYSFIIQVKDAYVTRRKGKTLLKYMQTYFSKDTFQVLGREYQIQYQGIASCDVQMKVDLIQVGNQYYPERVFYVGEWNIPGKRKEIGRFTASLFDFH